MTKNHIIDSSTFFQPFPLFFGAVVSNCKARKQQGGVGTFFNQRLKSRRRNLLNDEDASVAQRGWRDACLLLPVITYFSFPIKKTGSLKLLCLNKHSGTKKKIGQLTLYMYWHVQYTLTWNIRQSEIKIKIIHMHKNQVFIFKQHSAASYEIFKTDDSMYVYKNNLDCTHA